MKHCSDIWRSLWQIPLQICCLTFDIVLGETLTSAFKLQLIWNLTWHYCLVKSYCSFYRHLTLPLVKLSADKMSDIWHISLWNSSLTFDIALSETLLWHLTLFFLKLCSDIWHCSFWNSALTFDIVLCGTLLRHLTVRFIKLCYDCSLWSSALTFDTTLSDTLWHLTLLFVELCSDIYQCTLWNSLTFDIALSETLVWHLTSIYVKLCSDTWNKKWNRKLINYIREVYFFHH